MEIGLLTTLHSSCTSCCMKLSRVSHLRKWTIFKYKQMFGEKKGGFTKVHLNMKPKTFKSHGVGCTNKD